MEKSKCCNAKIIYVKDWGNKHDECSKCGDDLDMRKMLEEDEQKLSPVIGRDEVRNFHNFVDGDR